MKLEMTLPQIGVLADPTAVRHLAAAAEASYGRDPGAIRLVVRANVHLTDRLGGERSDFCGSLDQVAADVERACESGVDEMFLDLQSTATTNDELIDTAVAIASLAGVSEVA